MSGMIFVVEAKRTRSIDKQVREKVDAEQCVCCGRKIPMDRKPVRWRRGLCTTCEGRWDASKRGLSEQQIAELDAQLIRDGLLLGDGEIGEMRKGINPFAAKAAEVTGA